MFIASAPGENKNSITLFAKTRSKSNYKSLAERGKRNSWTNDQCRDLGWNSQKYFLKIKKCRRLLPNYKTRGKFLFQFRPKHV